jgi:hypothetical protein
MNSTRNFFPNYIITKKMNIYQLFICKWGSPYAVLV